MTPKAELLKNISRKCNMLVCAYHNVIQTFCIGDICHVASNTAHILKLLAEKAPYGFKLPINSLNNFTLFRRCSIG